MAAQKTSQKDSPIDLVLALMRQLMKHNEASARIALLSARETIVDYRRENAELRAKLRELEARSGRTAPSEFVPKPGQPRRRKRAA